MSDERPAVAIWKSTWLPPSQTFVSHQIGAMSRWRPITIGLRRDPEGLDVHVDRAPFSLSAPGRVARRLSAATGYRGVYDGLLRRERVRLVHAHFGTSAPDVLPVARRLGLPLVVTFHGYDATSALQGSGADRGYRERLGEVFAYASRLIAVSDFMAECLVDAGAPADRVTVHHIGVPVVPAPAEDSQRAGIVFVGRLVAKKGVPDLLDAVSRLPEPLRSTPVEIVGDGPLRAELEREATETGLDVTFRGRLDIDGVRTTMAHGAVFCAPSRTAPDGDAEGFGMVFAEAALQRLPVVAYAHGGVTTAVADGESGLLAPEGDVAALSDRLARVLRDPAYARTLGDAGRRRVVERFDVVTQTGLLEDLYDEVAARPPV